MIQSSCFYKLLNVGSRSWQEELSRLAGGRAPKGRRGSYTHGGVTTLLFALRNDTWVGNPSGSSSHLPYKAEEFFLRTGK